MYDIAAVEIYFSFILLYLNNSLIIKKYYLKFCL